MSGTLPSEVKEWFVRLDFEVHQVCKGERMTSDHSLRNLTKEEWKTVLEHIKRYELPCVLSHDAYGFALWVHEHGMLPGEIPKALLRIEDGQFPFPSSRLGFQGQPATVKKIAKITHTPRNTELLAWYGFRPLDRPESYVY